MGRPLVWFTVCWVLGSGVAASLPAQGIIVLAGAGLLALLLALVLLRRCSWPLAAACLAAYGFAAGQRMWTDARNVSGLPAQYVAALAASPEERVKYEAKLAGVITSPPQIDGDLVQFRVAGDSIELLQNADAPLRAELRGELYLVQVRLAKQQELLDAASWQRGQRVAVTGALSVPSGATNFGGFDYRTYLNGQRIHWLLGAAGAESVIAGPGPRWSTASLLQHMDALRASLGKRMDALYPGVQAGYMKGLVLGMSDDLDPDMYRRFSQLGLTHILAISGLHVAVFLYVLGGLLRLLRMTRERMLMIMIAAVPFYVFLSGASPSVIRAGIMAMLGLAAARLHKLRDGLHLLAAAALLMLLWDPYFLGNVGFQLSFLVTAGLIVGTSPVRKALPRGKRRWSASLFDMLAVTLVAQAVSLPVTIYYFNQLHALSTAANFILVPFISSIVMPLGGASLLLEGMWHPAGAMVAQLANIGNELTFGIVLKLSGLKSFRLIWATPPLWWIAAFYAALALLFHAFNRLQAAKGPLEEDKKEVPNRSGDLIDEPTQPLGQWSRPKSAGDIQATMETLSEEGEGIMTAPRPLEAEGGTGGWSAPFIELPSASRASVRQSRMKCLLASLALAGLLLGAYFPQLFDRYGYVDFMDVGQGDGIYIRTPGGKNILIDGGGAVSFSKQEAWRKRRDPYEVGRKTVVPLLQRRGVHEIDLLVLSHLHSDHIKGLLAVMDAIPVRAILWNGTVNKTEDAQALLRKAVNAGIPLYRAEGGRSWQMDRSTTLHVLGTPPSLLHLRSPLSVPQVEEQNVESVALLVVLNGRQFLFAGDAEVPEERSLLSQLAARSEAAAASGGPADSLLKPPIDVMKLSHHGSKTSTTAEWLAYWRPAEAVISVGRNNRYGHPHPTVMERLKQVGIPSVRTDLDGEVQFRIGPDHRLSQRKNIPGSQ